MIPIKSCVLFLEMLVFLILCYSQIAPKKNAELLLALSNMDMQEAPLDRRELISLLVKKRSLVPYF